MAVSLIITDRKVYNQYGNGLNYAINPSDFASYLRGGVMGVQKAVYTVELTWSDAFTSNDGDTWSVSGNTLSRQIGNWIVEGFSIGDTIDLNLESVGFLTSIFTNRVITNITETLIFFDGAPVIPASSSLFGNLQGGKTNTTGLEYSFGIIPNVDEPEFTSLLDNSEQTYYADGVGFGSSGGRSTAFVEMQPKTNSVQSWVTTRATRTQVRYVSNPSTYVQQFEIEHEYIINPYNDDSLFSGNNTLKYVSKFDFRTNLANINTSKVYIDDLQRGSVGNFDENFNGYNNDFSISDLVYTDVGSATTQTELNISSKTRVEFTINSVSGNFTTNDPLIAYHSFIPTFNQYNQNAEDYRDVWTFESVRTNIDGPFNIQGVFTKFESSLVTANEISVLIEIEFGADEIQYLEEGYEYKLALECGDGDTLNQTYNVTLLVDSNTYSKDANITDLIISDEFGFNPYYRFIAPTVDLFSTYKGWIEDEIVSYHRFGVNRLAAKDASILSGKFKIVAYEDATGETFDLQSEDLDLSAQLSAPIGTINANPFEIQLIQDERTRGYRLPSGDEFNLLLFETDDNDGTYQFYEWRVGFKMNWQDWIALPNADNIFIDTTKTFNGKNNNASNYSLKNGWSIRTIWQFDMQGLDDFGNIGETEYNFITDQHDIFDFDEQDFDLDGTPITWQCDIYTYDSLGNDLGGAILSDEYTFVKAIFDADVTITDILPYWAELRIAEQNQPGFNNDVLSSTKAYLENNRLIPLDGESYLKLTLVGGNIEAECRVDFNQLKENINYKLSARLANQDEPIPIIEWIFRTNINVPTDGTFNPRFSTIGGEIPTWELIGGYTESNTLLSIGSRTGLSGTPTSLDASELNGVAQDVKVTFSTNDATNITQILCNQATSKTFFVDDLDLSLFTKCSVFQINQAQISSLTLPVSTTNVSIFFLNTGFNITEIDFRPFGGFMGGNIQAIQNTSVLSYLFPTSNRLFSRLSINSSSSLNTAVDLSGLTRLGGQLFFHSNPLMPSISLPVTSENFTQIEGFSCSLIPSLDFSGFTGNITVMLVHSCPLLTTIQVPRGTSTIIRIYLCGVTTIDIVNYTPVASGALLVLSSNKLSVASIDAIIIHVNSTGAINGTLVLQGQTPAAPPSPTSAAALSNLISNGWIVTTD